MSASVPMFEIRPARETELDVLVGIAAKARAFMRSYGNTTQWPEGTPSREKFAADLARGDLWLAVDGDEVLGSMSILKSPDPTYAVIDGAWIGGEPYHAVHRVMVASPGRGLGKAMLNWAYENFGHLRIDTHEKNAPMLATIRACGFTECGVVIVEDGSERVAFERL